MLKVGDIVYMKEVEYPLTTQSKLMGHLCEVKYDSIGTSDDMIGVWYPDKEDWEITWKKDVEELRDESHDK